MPRLGPARIPRRPHETVLYELVREHYYRAFDFRFLLWNLFLAWIPLLVALVVYDGYRRGARMSVLVPGVILWLLFLPNAPYIVTDLVHLEPWPPVPMWFDIALVLSFACTGLLLCFASTADVHAVITRRFGPRAGWGVAMAAMVARATSMTARVRNLRVLRKAVLVGQSPMQWNVFPK